MSPPPTAGRDPPLWLLRRGHWRRCLRRHIPTSFVAASSPSTPGEHSPKRCETPTSPIQGATPMNWNPLTWFSQARDDRRRAFDAGLMVSREEYVASLLDDAVKARRHGLDVTLSAIDAAAKLD